MNKVDQLHIRNFLNHNTGSIIPALVTFIVAFLYLSIAPTRLTSANFGGDAGDFLSAILTRGIPHPTGYPTYTILGILFQYLPVSTPVFRGVLGSLIPASLAAGLLTAWVLFVCGEKTALYLSAAAIAGLAWGTAPLLFSQAVIVEVHGLQSLFMVLTLWWITFNLRPDSQNYVGWILGLSLLVGLGFGNHILGALLLPAALLAWIIFVKRTGSWALVLVQLVMILVGLLVYIYLPLSARGYSPVNWGNPQTWSGFLWEVTGNPYRGLLFGAAVPVVWERIRSVSSLLMDQFGPLGLVAGAIGAIQFSFPIKWLRWILVWSFIVYFIVAIGYNTLDSVGYLLPAVMVYAIWIGLAVVSLWSLNWKRIPVGIILIVLLVVFMGIRIPGTRDRLDPRLQDEPARFAEQLLKDAPRDAIVFTTTDGDTFPLWYYHFGLHARSDLRVVVRSLTQFVWYQQTLEHTYPDLEYPPNYNQDRPDIAWGEQLSSLNPDRPVCDTQLNADSETGISYQCSSP